jgi:hypothetical protein
MQKYRLLSHIQRVEINATNYHTHGRGSDRWNKGYVPRKTRGLLYLIPRVTWSIDSHNSYYLPDILRDRATVNVVLFGWHRVRPVQRIWDLRVKVHVVLIQVTVSWV